MQTNSVIGNVATLQAGQVLLPSFVTQHDDGLYLDLSALDSPDILLRFVDHVFASSACFSGLDYPLFQNLLFEITTQEMARWLDRFEQAGTPPLVRFCRDIVAFPASRQALYRGLKIAANGALAEYLFEQIHIDHVIETPLYGAADANGDYPVVGVEKTSVNERAFLDLDEFVAALWMKGVRFGIDTVLVSDILAMDRAERLTIAQEKSPTAGADASIEERSDELHRSDAPRLLPNGKVDLRKFQNRFPQVMAGKPLVRKLPRVLGVSGWTVRGKEVLPEVPKDFDLATLAGPGTRVMRDGDGEFILATMDGFLNIDTQSSLISVSEKIISREGVSMRTTGDLALAGDEFEEHGEVQERRVVEGRHMSFFADVFGEVYSDAGRVLFKRGIAGGIAKSPGGSICVEGTASRALLEAKRGHIDVAVAESTLIIGQSVRIGRAVRCEIVADEVTIEQAEGCAIAAKSVQVGLAAARKDQGNIVHLLMPDVEHFEKKIEAASKERRLAEAAIEANKAALADIVAQPDMKTYLTVQPRLKAKTLTMTADQDRNWQALLARIAPRLRDYARLMGEQQKLTDDINNATARIAAWQQERIDAISAIHCQIDNVRGETLVRRRYVRPSTPALQTLGAKELRLTLRDAGELAERLFFGDSGKMQWPPGDEEKAS